LELAKDAHVLRIEQHIGRLLSEQGSGRRNAGVRGALGLRLRGLGCAGTGARESVRVGLNFHLAFFARVAHLACKIDFK
jgi:hypothetical protein